AAGRVRRSPSDEWAAIDWTEEFADIIRRRTFEEAANDSRENATAARSSAIFKPEIASRYDPTRIKTIGLRGLVEELIAALDNTLARPKLLVAGGPRGFSAPLIAIVPHPPTPDPGRLRWLPPPAAAGVCFF